MITEWGRGKGFVWVRVWGAYVVSAYVSPNCSIQVFERFLRDLHFSLRNMEGGF